MNSVSTAVMGETPKLRNHYSLKTVFLVFFAHHRLGRLTYEVTLPYALLYTRQESREVVANHVHHLSEGSTNEKAAGSPTHSENDRLAGKVRVFARNRSEERGQEIMAPIPIKRVVSVSSEVS